MQKVRVFIVVLALSIVSAQAQEFSLPEGLSDLGNLGSMLEAIQKPAESNEQYRFDLIVVSETLNVAENTTSKLTQYFADEAFYVEIDQDNATVLDFDNQSIIIIDKKENTQRVVTTEFFKQMTQLGQSFIPNQGSTVSVKRIFKQDEVKQILGFDAELWKMEGDSNTADAWVARAIDFDFVAFSQKLLSLFDSAGGSMVVDFSELDGELPPGLPLEVTTYEDGRKDSVTKMLSVDESGATLDLSRYRKVSMLGL